MLHESALEISGHPVATQWPPSGHHSGHPVATEKNWGFCIIRIREIESIYLFYYPLFIILQKPQFFSVATVVATVVATGWPLGGHWVATDP